MCPEELANTIKINKKEGILIKKHQGIGKELWPYVLKYTSWMDADEKYASQQFNYNRKTHYGVTSQQRWCAMVNLFISEDKQPKCEVCGGFVKIQGDGRLSRTCSLSCSKDIAQMDKLGREKFFELRCPIKLYDLYRRNEYNGLKVSDYFGISFPVIYSRFREYGIVATKGADPTFPTNINLIWKYGKENELSPTKEVSHVIDNYDNFLDCFINNELSYKRMAKRLGVNEKTIKTRAQKHGLTINEVRKTTEPYKTLLNRDRLVALYSTSNRSSYVTANKLGVTYNTVLFWMKKHGIARNGIGGGDVMSKTRTKEDYPCHVYVFLMKRGDREYVKVGISTCIRSRANSVQNDGVFDSLEIIYTSKLMPLWHCGVIEHIVLTEIGCVRTHEEIPWDGHTECVHPCFATRIKKTIDALQMSNLEQHHVRIFGDKRKCQITQ